MILTYDEMQDRIYDWAEDQWLAINAFTSKELGKNYHEVEEISEPELDQLEKGISYVHEDNVDDYFYNYAVELVNERSDLPEQWKVYFDYKAFAEDLQVDYGWVKICGENYIIIY